MVRGVKNGFTLIELLIVVGILAVIGTATVFVINPVELLARSRDSRRLEDLNKLSTTLQVYETQAGALGGSPNTVYISLPNTLSDCTGAPTYTLPSLPSGWSYNCATEANFRNINGDGWIPTDFTRAPGLGLALLPIDPINSDTDQLYYTYIKGSWNITAKMESNKLSQTTASTDNGTDPTRYEKGSDLNVWNQVSGLVGYWKLDDGSGTVTVDSSGNDKNGTLNNGPIWSSLGRIGGALSFDGVNDYVSFSSGSLFNIIPGEVKTFTIWFKGSLDSSRDSTILWQDGNCIGWSSHMSSAGGLRAVLHTGNSGCTGYSTYSLNSTINYDDDKWHFAVTVVDRPNLLMTLYVDGVTRGTVAIDNALSGTGGSARIGTNWNNTTPFNGLVDDIRIYNRALSASEIEAIYNATK
ncbi:MAG TPA: LamG-like jellyroll fold domain-containing protein [Candidatus Paceibacterota bacterium]